MHRGRTWIACLASSLAISAGCAGLVGDTYDEPEAEVPVAAPAPPAPPAVPEPTGCAAWRAGSPSVHLPAPAHLRALLGQPPDGGELKALAARLGPPRVQVGRDRIIHDFADHGLTLVFERDAAGTRLSEVDLNGRVDRMSPWAGALPAGLDFRMDGAEVERTLGGPDFGTCRWEDCPYLARGLRVRLDRAGCLGRVSLTPAVGPEQLRLQGLLIRQAEKRNGVSGVAISMIPTAGWQRERREIDLELMLNDANGHPVRVSRQAERIRTDDGRLRLRAALGGIGSAGRVELFVPYWALELGPGPHALTGRITARASAAGPLFGPRPPYAPVALEVVGQDGVAFDLSMPKLSRVRLRVSSLQLEPGLYDDIERNTMAATVATGGALWFFGFTPKRYERPDPFWALVLGDQQVYRSAAVQDVHRARWRGPSSWLRLAPGDEVLLLIEDEDLGGAEVLARFSLGVDEIARRARERAALSSGPVKALLLGRPELRRLSR